MVGPLEMIHDAYVRDRRCSALAAVLAPLVSPGSRVLDVGCGDGRISRRVQDHVGADFTGVDVVVRPNSAIPVTHFDGVHLPFADGAFDTVMIVDVVHHAADQMGLLREVMRVARSAVVIKDVHCDRWLARKTLAFMDRVGNDRFGIESPETYWLEAQWRRAFQQLEAEVTFWTTAVPLYPFWASWLFARGLHFVARLEPA